MSNKADKHIDPVVQVQKEANAITNAVERQRLMGEPARPVSVYNDSESDRKMENVISAADKVMANLGLPPHRFTSSQDVDGQSGSHEPLGGSEGTLESSRTAGLESEDGSLHDNAPEDSHASGLHSQTQTEKPSTNDPSGISTKDWAMK